MSSEEEPEQDFGEPSRALAVLTRLFHNGWPELSESRRTPPDMDPTVFESFDVDYRRLRPYNIAEPFELCGISIGGDTCTQYAPRIPARFVRVYGIFKSWNERLDIFMKTLDLAFKYPEDKYETSPAASLDSRLLTSFEIDEAVILRALALNQTLSLGEEVLKSTSIPTNLAYDAVQTGTHSTNVAPELSDSDYKLEAYVCSHSTFIELYYEYRSLEWWQERNGYFISFDRVIVIPLEDVSDSTEMLAKTLVYTDSIWWNGRVTHKLQIACHRETIGDRC